EIQTDSGSLGFHIVFCEGFLRLDSSEPVQPRLIAGPGPVVGCPIRDLWPPALLHNPRRIALRGRSSRAAGPGGRRVAPEADGGPCTPHPSGSPTGTNSSAPTVPAEWDRYGAATTPCSTVPSRSRGSAPTRPPTPPATTSTPPDSNARRPPPPGWRTPGGRPPPTPRWTRPRAPATW